MHQPKFSNFKPYSVPQKASLDSPKPSGPAPDFVKNDPSQKTKVNKKNPQRNEQIEAQIKKIGFRMSPKGIQKNLLIEDISVAISNFFSPVVNSILKEERGLCLKLGYPVDQPVEEKTKNKQFQEIQEESKVQSPKVNKKKSEKNAAKEKNQPKNQAQKKQSTVQSKISQTKTVKKPFRRRIIRKEVKKAAHPAIKRSNEEKILAREMEKKYNVKLRNNRLYMEGMPKKPVSSFFFFFKDYSSKLNAENEQQGQKKQNKYGSILAKTISKKWQELSEEQKKPYYEKSKVTRQAYKEEMDEWRRQNKEVYDSFKKIKRVKANETRRIKIQRDSLSLSKSDLELDDHRREEAQISLEENSESEEEERTKPLKTQENSKEAIILEENDEDLEIMIPEGDEAKNQKNKKENRCKNMRERFKSAHKPKSPAPSFFFYYNEKKSEIAKEHNVTRGARITQIASVQWKQLTEEEKKPYQAMADERRKKYYEEMKDFQKNHPQEWSKMQAYKRKVATTNLMTRKKKSDQVDSEEVSQVNSESVEEREEIQEVDSLEGQVVKKIETKRKRQPVKPKDSHKIIEEKNQISQTSAKNEESSPKPSRRRPIRKEVAQKNQTKQIDYREHRPKAPISSFFMFYKMNNSILAEQFKESNGGKLVKYASEIWKNMTDTQKKPYEIQSEKSRENYYTQMEAYKEKYPEEIKQRKLELKKRQQKAAEEGQIPKKKKKIPSSNEDLNSNQEKAVKAFKPKIKVEQSEDD